MSGKLLDTNIIIRYIKEGGNLDSLFEEENLFYSSITLGELLFGAELSSRKEHNAAIYTEFCQELEEIKVDGAVVPFYAKIKAQLKSDGHPIPENDIWIAACAMARNLTVVTSDAHFSFINGIKLQKIPL